MRKVGKAAGVGWHEGEAAPLQLSVHEAFKAD